jgi:hypothetical protein
LSFIPHRHEDFSKLVTCELKSSAYGGDMASAWHWIEGKQSMNYLKFYAINIHLEKVMEDFRWGNDEMLRVDAYQHRSIRYIVAKVSRARL